MNTHIVDKINLALLAFAFVVAYIIPFELLIISYAFLGPLHYLTEISWLHDRKYFTLLPEDSFYLVVGSLVLLYASATIFPSSSELVWILLLFAFCAAFVRSMWKRLLIIFFGIVLLVPWLGSTASYATSVLVPTVIHVYIFTVLFMLLGALRSKSSLGYINTAAFFFGGLLLIALPQSGLLFFPNFVADHALFFGSNAEALGSIFSFPSEVVFPAIASFLSFTYTYHYLNWFSKTSIIEWHAISVRRAFIIGVLYAVAVGIYLYSFELGFIVLLSLSFLHVVLEFPLNFKSIAGIYQSIRARR